MSAIVSDPVTIRSIIQEAVGDAVSRILPQLVRDATRKPYLTRAEMRELTGYSDRTLQHLRDTRQIPFVRVGRKILYPTDGVLVYLESRSVKVR